MSEDELRRAHVGRPFRPFELVMSDRQRIVVPHPEFMAIAPRGVMAYVWDDQNLPIWVDIANITAIDFRRRKPKKNGRKR